MGYDREILFDKGFARGLETGASILRKYEDACYNLDNLAKEIDWSERMLKKVPDGDPIGYNHIGRLQGLRAALKKG